MSKNPAFTLTELLVASVITILLLASVFGAFVITKDTCYNSVAASNLQRDANTILGKIIRGTMEGSTALGLRSAVSFTLPVTAPAGSEIDFVGTDNNARRYFLNGNSIIYQSPTRNPNQQAIYTIPANSVLTLRFWEPSGYVDHETVGIYISLVQRIGNKNVSGSVSTYVNLRNLPK